MKGRKAGETWALVSSPAKAAAPSVHTVVPLPFYKQSSLCGTQLGCGVMPCKCLTIKLCRCQNQIHLKRLVHIERSDLCLVETGEDLRQTGVTLRSKLRDVTRYLTPLV